MSEYACASMNGNLQWGNTNIPGCRNPMVPAVLVPAITVPGNCATLVTRPSQSLPHSLSTTTIMRGRLPFGFSLLKWWSLIVLSLRLTDSVTAQELLLPIISISRCTMDFVPADNGGFRPGTRYHWAKLNPNAAA